MSPVTHGLISWCVALHAGKNSRDRALITFAGLAPDLDGFGFLPELLTRNSKQPLLWFSEFHHVIGHGLFGAALLCAAAVLFGKDKTQTMIWAFAVFHMHLLCDLAGGQGPDGEVWPLYYLWPVSDWPALSWSGQWKLNAWPNFAVTIFVLAYTLGQIRRKGFGPLEFIFPKTDEKIVLALRGKNKTGK